MGSQKTEGLSPLERPLGTSTQGTCSGSTTVTCTVGTMLSGATVTITIRGTVTSMAPMTNTATVTSIEADSSMPNNTSTSALAVADNIPTLGEYGLLLVLTLAVAGSVVMKR